MVGGHHFRLEAIASRLEAIATRLEAIAIWLEAITIRLEAIAISFPKNLGTKFGLISNDFYHTPVGQNAKNDQVWP